MMVRYSVLESSFPWQLERGIGSLRVALAINEHSSGQELSLALACEMMPGAPVDNRTEEERVLTVGRAGT